MRSALNTLLLLAAGAALAQDGSPSRDIQWALIQRDQQSSEFAAQVRGGVEARHSLEGLHERQLRERSPTTAHELLPYERQRFSSESENLLRLTPPVERPAGDVLLNPLALPGRPRPLVEPVAPPGLGG